MLRFCTHEACICLSFKRKQSNGIVLTSINDGQ